jgi:hypothetical protein
VARGRYPHSRRFRPWRGPGPDRGGWPPAPGWVLAQESATYALFANSTAAAGLAAPLQGPPPPS